VCCRWSLSTKGTQLQLSHSTRRSAIGTKKLLWNSGNCNYFIPNFRLLWYFPDTLHECTVRNGVAQVISDTLCSCDTIRDCVSTLCIPKPYTYRFDTLHTFLALYLDTLHTDHSDILFRHPTYIPAFAGDTIRDSIPTLCFLTSYTPFWRAILTPYTRTFLTVYSTPYKPLQKASTHCLSWHPAIFSDSLSWHPI